MLVLVGIGLFIGLLALASRQPDSPTRANLIGPAIVLLLLVVATMLVVPDPNGGCYPFFYYASAGASALLPARRAIGLMILAGLAGRLAIYFVSGPVGAMVQGLSVTIIGVTVFSTGQVRRTNRELVEARGELARLAVADERVRIARDLHDSLGQSLALVTLKSELAGRLLPDQPKRAREEVQDIERVSREAMASVRETVGRVPATDAGGRVGRGPRSARGRRHRTTDRDGR